jgi:hypothetical protein
MSRKRKVVVMPAPKADPPAGNSSWPHAIGTLAIGAVVAIGLVTIGSWIEVHTRPPPGWVCLNVERVTADGRQHGSRCEPARGWHVEVWDRVGEVAVPDRTVVMRRHFVARD